MSRSTALFLIALASLADQPGARAALGRRFQQVPLRTETREPRTTRVVLLSIDAGADWIVDRLIEQGKAPAFAAIAREGASADAMVGAMPSLTAVAHATLWTGTWPRFHGVVGNQVSPLPRADHTILETQSGFESQPLRAEPIWTTAARAGRRVLVLQATGGAPFSGMYPNRLLQFDVYANRLIEEGDIEGRVLGGQHTFILGDTRCVLSPGSDGSLILQIGEQQTTLRPGRAGRFSPPMPVRFKDREVGIRFRLISYGEETGAFRLLHGVGNVITSSDPARVTEFRTHAGALVGEEVVDDYQRNRFGPTLAAGGDGEAEEWLTECVLANQEYFEGAVDFASRESWDLLVLYVPNFDTASHALVGMVDPSSPKYSAEIAARAWPVLERLFALTVDSFAADLRRRFPDATLVIVADHGMEGTGRLVRPNVALRKAGLLTLNAQESIDLSKTEAAFVHSKGNMIFVNSTDWKSGIVPAERREDVKRRAAGILLRIRDPWNGQPAIRATFDSNVDGPGLGIGGEAAGDLYFDPQPGYYTQNTPTGDREVVDGTETGSGSHGPAPWRRNLQPIFYSVGPDVRAGTRLGLVRAIDVAPTVAELLGIPPPAHSIGRALALQ